MYFAGASALLAFLYLYIEPKLVKHDWWKDTLDLSIMLCMAGLGIALVLNAVWRIPNSTENILYDIFLVRANGQADSSHVTAFLTVPIMFFWARMKWRDSWRSFLFVSLLIFLFDRLWFIFYYLEYSSVFSWADELWPNATFYLLFIAVALVYYKKYGFDRKMLIMVLPQLVYDIIWFMAGFHVSVSNSHALADVYRLTPYWGDLWTNAIEVCSSLLHMTTTILYLRSMLCERSEHHVGRSSAYINKATAETDTGR